MVKVLLLEIKRWDHRQHASRAEERVLVLVQVPHRELIGLAWNVEVPVIHVRLASLGHPNAHPALLHETCGVLMSDSKLGDAWGKRTVTARSAGV